MGAGNVKLVFTRWGDLPHGPFRVLTFMALVSLDDDHPPRFWGGRESLVVALGRKLPDEVDEDTKRERQAAFKAARDATTTLTKRGAITVVRTARPGQRQEWILNLDRTMVHEKRAPVVHGKRAQRCTENVRMVHEDRAPEEEQEDSGLTTGVMEADLRNGGTGSAHTRVRDAPDDSSITERSHDTHGQEHSNDGQLCRDCGTVLDPDGSCFVCTPVATWRSS
jgi:hypothetical protein